MVVVVLIPFLPIMVTLTALNISKMGPVKPYNYAVIHEHQTPYPWDSIIYVSSDQIDAAWMSNDYISLLAVISLYLFFGMSKDAINEYRIALLFFGLGKVFPRLYEEYDPDRYRGSQGSSSYRVPCVIIFFSITFKEYQLMKLLSGLSKIKSITSPRQLASISSSFAGTNSRSPQSFDVLSSVDTEAGHAADIQRPKPSQQPMAQVEEVNPPIQPPHRHPFLFRTRLDVSSFTLPFFNRPASNTERVHYVAPEPRHRVNAQSPWDEREKQKPQVETRVWSDEDVDKQPGGHRGHRHRHSEGAVVDSGAQGLSVQGVVIETALTRESHQSGQN